MLLPVLLSSRIPIWFLYSFYFYVEIDYLFMNFKCISLRLFEYTYNDF